MRLFIIHAGYYDGEIGIYELHTNFFIAAPSIHEVKKLVQQKDIFKKKNMHIDAIQEIEVIDGFRIELVKDSSHVEKLTHYTYSQVKELSTGHE